MAMFWRRLQRVRDDNPACHNVSKNNEKVIGSITRSVVRESPWNGTTKTTRQIEIVIYADPVKLGKCAASIQHVEPDFFLKFLVPISVFSLLLLLLLSVNTVD